ncbi:hypothetical protein [Actinobacillus arthritidis]|uniref:hypothetical protein n=1 Tax=Actinobacillus arthritidis TaxID=157339 RepID=UPI002441F170|nr:hypothetical protein [Actinobacillus arthritidis]WGE89053.1 hypothetical protein NYR89_08360 [Actinobacillus arthritidis]
MSEIKKSAKYDNFVIAQDKNNAISITCDNTKEGLRQIADEVGMAYDAENTQSLGSKLINHLNGVERNVRVEDESGVKKSAKHGNFVIEQAEDNSIAITCDNTKAGLRQIAEKIGMAYDNGWTTQQFGSRLINFLNGDSQGDEVQNVQQTTTPSKPFDEDNLISDADWD